MNAVAPDWQYFYIWVALCLLTSVLSYFACLWAMTLARKWGMITQPGTRQSHDIATPTGGGLGLITSVVVALCVLQLLFPISGFWWLGILPGVILLTVIGWLDDKSNISSLLRLSVQLAVSIWLLGFAWLQFSVNDLGLFTLGVVSVVWLMNLYNFMDGSNGMAGFQGVFAGVTMAVLFQLADQYTMALASLTVAAACAGFLPLNFPQARVFMGDAASVPLGFVFASLAVFGALTGSISLFVSILIMSVFIVDATMTLFTRVIRGERWYTAHAQHVYQRLIAHGWSHYRVLVAYQAINVILVLPAIVLVEMYPQYAVMFAGSTLLILGVFWQIANRRLGMLAKVQLK